MLHAAWFKCTPEILWSVKYSSFQSVILAYVILILAACHIHGFFPKIANWLLFVRKGEGNPWGQGKVWH